MRGLHGHSPREGGRHHRMPMQRPRLVGQKVHELLLLLLLLLLLRS